VLGEMAYRESARQGGVKGSQLYRCTRKDASGQDASNRDSFGRGGLHDKSDY